MRITKRNKILIIRLFDYYKIDNLITKNIKENIAFKWINTRSDVNILNQIKSAKNSIIMWNKESYLLNLKYER